jgi:hypothetical protein
MGLRQVLPVQTKRTRFKTGVRDGSEGEGHLAARRGFVKHGGRDRERPEGSRRGQISFANAEWCLYDRLQICHTDRLQACLTSIQTDDSERNVDASPVRFAAGEHVSLGF